MSSYCEVCESVALATSSCPATDIIMVLPNTAGSSSSADFSGPFPRPFVGTANATSPVMVEAYAIMRSAADAHSTVSHTLHVSSSLRSAGNGISSVFQALNQMAVSSANAASELSAMDVPAPLVSAAIAISTVELSTEVYPILNSVAKGLDSVTLGLTNVINDGINAVSTVVLLRRVPVELVSSAAATSTVTPQVLPGVYLLVSNAVGVSVVQLNNSSNIFIEADANATGSAWFKNPASKAWVMSTETSAMGWYDNYEFESIAQVGNKTLAVGPDGLYELTGDLDAGVKIQSRVESGFSDFGSTQTKRLDAMYFGYTSDGQIAVKTEVTESGNAPATYMLEERLAESPRNSRVVPGKGLWGRYWRLTITNVDGADFKISDASVDIAQSMRRV